MDEGLEVSQHGPRILDRVILGDQNLMVKPVPTPSPVLVRPDHAEGDVDLRVCQHPLERGLHQEFAREPIEVIGEPRDAVVPGHGGLLAHDLRQSQIVIAQVDRTMGLVVARPERARCSDIGPFGESHAPPSVVLGEWMELRQVERDGAHDGVGKRRVLPVLDEAFLDRRVGNNRYIRPILRASERRGHAFHRRIGRPAGFARKVCGPRSGQ